jgi:hypothetical protein
MSPEKDEELGQRVLEAVGLRLVKYRSVSSLGATVAQLAIEAKHVNDRATRLKKKKQRAEMEKIAAEAKKVATRLKTLKASLDSDTLDIIHTMERGSNSLSYLEEVTMKCGAAAWIIDHSESFPTHVDSLKVLIGEKLRWLFVLFFGDSAPTYTFDTAEQTYDGPFIRFARFVLDEAEIDLSDGAIAQYLKRMKKEPREIPWYFQGPGPRDKI